MEGSLLQSSLNFAALKTRGIDVEIDLSHEFDGFGTVSTRLNYTHNFLRDSFASPTDPTFISRILQSLGDPEDEFSLKSNVEVGKFTFGYDLRYIGKQLNVGYTSIFPLNGSPPQNTDASETNFYPAVFYHDIRFALEVNKQFNLYGGINNVTNKAPPLGTTGIGGGSGIFDNRGRFFYMGVKVNY